MRDGRDSKKSLQRSKESTAMGMKGIKHLVRYHTPLGQWDKDSPAGAKVSVG